MTDLIQARDDITDAVDRALSLAAKEASEHVHQLDLLKAQVAELEAELAIAKRALDGPVDLG